MRTTDRVIDRRILLEASSLVQNGYKVTVIAGPYPKSVKVPRIEIWQGVKIHRLQRLDTWFYFKFQKYLNFIHRFCRRNLYFIHRFFRRNLFTRGMGFIFCRVIRWLSQSSSVRKRKLCRPSTLITIIGVLLLAPFLLFEYLKQVFQELFLQMRKNITLTSQKRSHKAVKEICAQEVPDICHAHDLVTLEEMYDISRQHNSKFVYDSHELYVEIRTLTSSQKENLTNIEADLIKKTDLVITINDSIAKELSDRYGITKPLVIMNATESIGDVQQEACFYLHDKLHLDRCVDIILYQGNLTPGRGLDILIESAKYLNDDNVKLVLLGNEVAPGYRKKLLRIVKKYSLQNKIVFLKAVPQEELLYYTVSAKAGIIPYGPVDLNTYYCTPNKLFEFIVAQIPILSNDLPELKKLVEGNEIGISTDMSTPEEMARAITEMQNNDESYARFKKNLISVSKELCWEKESSILLDGYNRLFARSEKC